MTSGVIAHEVEFGVDLSTTTARLMINLIVIASGVSDVSLGNLDIRGLYAILVAKRCCVTICKIIELDSIYLIFSL